MNRSLSGLALLLCFLLSSCAETAPRQAFGPPKWKGIWTVEFAHVRDAFFHPQPVFRREEAPAVVIAGHGGENVSWQIVDRNSGRVVETDNETIPMGHRLLHVYPRFRPGEYVVRLRSDCGHDDEFFFEMKKD